MGFTGLKNLDDVLASKKEIKLGGTRPGAGTDDFPKLMNVLAGVRFNVISGHKGTAPIRVAMQRREVEGACWTWDSMRVTARPMLDAKGDDKLIPFIIHGKSPDPEAEKSKLLIEYTSGEEIEKYVEEILSIPGGAKEKLQFLTAR
jgi:hypothetical protein